MQLQQVQALELGEKDSSGGPGSLFSIGRDFDNFNAACDRVG